VDVRAKNVSENLKAIHKPWAWSIEIGISIDQIDLF
jgi:hypothetical protein